MELKLNYVNRIKTADMKINGLTVVVGPNNSGKSTIGRTLYSVVKAIANTNLASEEDNEDRIRKHIDSMYSRLRGLGRVAVQEELTGAFPRNSAEFLTKIKETADPLAFLREKRDISLTWRLFLARSRCCWKTSQTLKSACRKRTVPQPTCVRNYSS